MNDSEAIGSLVRSISRVVQQSPESSNSHMAIQIDDDRARPKSITQPLRDFWWDKVILTMILLILGITGAQTVGFYLKSAEAKCLIEENHTQNEEDYINQLCTGATPTHLYGRSVIYFAIALLSGMQLFWMLICGGRIESFKSTICGMSLKRNPKTGLFEASDLESARYLERLLYSRALTCTYFLFKIVQLLFCVPSIIVPFFLFEFSTDVVFICSSGSFYIRQWPLSASNIYCTDEEIPSLHLLRWVNMAAVLMIVLAIICGIIVLIYRFHSFDYKQIASFILRTGLKQKHYTLFKDKVLWKTFCCTQSNSSVQHQSTASWDMMFLIIRQYETNKKSGEALLNCLISVHLDFLAECTCAQKHKVTNHKHEHQDSNDVDGQHVVHGVQHIEHFNNHLEKIIEELVQKLKTRGSGSKPYGILVTNWNDSLAYLNSIHFEGMICINFNSNITDKDASVFQRNHRTNMIPIYHTPSHLWSWTCSEGPTSEKIDLGIKGIIEDLCKKQQHPLMILLAPLSDEVYNVHHLELRVRNLLWCLHHNDTAKKHTTYVGVVSPTTVIARDLTGDYVQSEVEETWWLKAGVNEHTCSSSSETKIPKLVVRGNSAIAGSVKYEYSYSLCYTHVPHVCHKQSQIPSNGYEGTDHRGGASHEGTDLADNQDTDQNS